MTMRFAALERKRAAGFARISIESVGGFKFNALLWHFGFASLKDKKTLDHRIPCVHWNDKVLRIWDCIVLKCW